jgi:hypothetical protein
MVSAVSGLLLALSGGIVLPMTDVIPRVAGAEVAMSAVGTAFVLVGLTIAVLGLRMKAARTYLSIDSGALRVRVGDDRGPEYELPIEDVEQVAVEADNSGFAPSYRAEIRLRSGRAIPLGETLTASRRHQERIARDIRDFLG